MLVLMAFGAVVLLSLLPIGIAMETAGRTTDARWDAATIWAARAVGSGLPLVLLAYAAWLINAPEELRQTLPLRYAIFAATGVLLVAGAIVSVQELARWNKEAEGHAAVDAPAGGREGHRTSPQVRGVDRRRHAVTWHQYTYHSSPDDIRLDALRRIAARANLEAELVAVLDSENHLWAAEGVRLVADLPFVPSAALAEAVRKRLDAYAAGLREGAKTVTYDGDKRIDYYEQSRLREALAASRKLAEAAGADCVRRSTLSSRGSRSIPNPKRRAASRARPKRPRRRLGDAGEAAQRAAADRGGSRISYDAFCSSRSSSLRRNVSSL